MLNIFNKKPNSFKLRQMKRSNLLFVFILLMMHYCPLSFSKTKKVDVVTIENTEMCLTIQPDGKIISLKHKDTGQECLADGESAPLCAITEYRPYDNELFLTYPAKKRTFYANQITRIGNQLKVGFEEIAYTATIDLTITKNYIGFKLSDLEYKVEKIGIKRKTEIDEFTLLQLPLHKRTYFGEWLNVVWDKNVAINLLATDTYARIDAINNNKYNLLYAGMDNKVKLMGVGAALITTTPDKLLDRIDSVEEDYNLPRGVQSRRNAEYSYSYYELRDVTVNNIDEHIYYAKRGGFKTMVIYYPDFSTAMGHFPWNNKYPNGIEDLKTITRKIKKAGMIPGFHIHYNKAAKNDLYVSPIPDSRLNLVRMFTLSDSISEISETIGVEENPEGCVMENDRRFLKIGNELVTYESYTTEPPFVFSGCKRGVLGSKIKSVEKGFKFGLLDVDTWPLFVRFDQNTSIQEEVAKRIGEIYKSAGFEFVYFDGAEDVHPPYWYNVSRSQLIVYNELHPKPLFAEGALKSHFGWHILSRGNAFDLFPPEAIREATNKYTLKAAEYIAQDFTSINFGWNDYLAPSDKTTGMQPDMYEYICSKAAAWDCPIALMGKLDQLKAHPRTNDNLEVIRNWEEARIQKKLTLQQKELLKDKSKEFILLQSKDDFELYPYERIIMTNNPEVHAFVFQRRGKTNVVYWHERSEGKILLKKASDKIKLFNRIDNLFPFEEANEGTVIPVGKRYFLEIDLPKKEIQLLLKEAQYIALKK